MSHTVLDLWDLHSQRENGGGVAEEMCRTTSYVRKTVGCTRREVRVNFCAAPDQMEEAVWKEGDADPGGHLKKFY